jgi:hypothetical protein
MFSMRIVAAATGDRCGPGLFVDAEETPSAASTATAKMYAARDMTAH